MKKLAEFLPALLKTPARWVRDAIRQADDEIRSIYLEPARRNRREEFLSGLNKEKEITLFLGPEAALESFFASHVLIARVLKDAGRTPLLLSCYGIQPACSAKAVNHIYTAPAEDNSVCRHCRAVANTVGRNYGLADVSIETILGREELAKIERAISALGDHPWDLEEDGIEIGRACLGEALRTLRKLSLDELSTADKSLIAALAYSSLAVYRSVKLLLERYNIRHIAYFGDYAFFIAPQILARKNGIALTNISHAYNRDIDRRFLNLRPGHGFSHMMSQVDKWPAISALPIPAETIAQILDGGLYRMRGFGGASTYSPNWSHNSGNFLSQLSLPPGGRLLVAFSNSTDELLCNREILRAMDIPYAETRNPFYTQVEWLTALISWVGARPDLRLIIRLHPRMAKGHRHPHASSEVAQMRHEFATLPSNVAIVWPESKISSYNIAEVADVALTAWSSIGLELARLGVPLVSAFQRIGPWPAGKFNWFSETREGYFQLIEQALNRPPSMDGVLDAFRWTYCLNWTPLIDISDITPDADYSRVPPYRSPINRDLILKSVVEGIDLVDLALGKLSATREAVAAERAALEAAMGQAFKYLLTGQYQSAPHEYVILQPDRKPVAIGSGAGPRIHVAANHEVTYEDDEQTIRRHSPLIARLARSVASRVYN